MSIRVNGEKRSEIYVGGLLLNIEFVNKLIAVFGWALSIIMMEMEILVWVVEEEVISAVFEKMVDFVVFVGH